ncbi:hypothetical protein CsSME_00053087 [Camellia sinensis var. sinensis]
MGIVELNRRLRINLGVPAIRHSYALAKSSGRLGRYFLRTRDTDHHLVTMLASSGKRVDDVMVNVHDNWEFGEGEDRLDLVPRKRGNKLKKIQTSADDAVLVEIKTALKYFGRPNVQKQGRAAYILLWYEPT